MFAQVHHSATHPAIGRFSQFVWRIVEALQPPPSSRIPPELGRLPDRLLKDIGVGRGELPPVLDDLMMRADMLESRTAVAAWLAATTR